MATYTPSSLPGVLGGGDTIYQVSSSASATWQLQVNGDGEIVNYALTGYAFNDAAATIPYANTASALLYVRIPPFPSHVFTPSSTTFRVLQNGQTGNVPITTTICQLPLPVSYSYEFSPSLPGTVINKKKTGEIIGRILGDGVIRRNFRLRWENLLVREYLVLERFWKWHAPGRGIKFQYTDVALGVTGNFRFGSPLNAQVTDKDTVNVTVDIQEVP